MSIKNYLDQFDFEPKSSFITMGNFDGVHLGHQWIINQLKELSKISNKKSTLLQFWPHPREVLRDETVPRICDRKETEKILKELGVERHVVLPFTKELASYPSQQFIEEILVEGLGMGGLLLGYDHKFGKGRDSNDDQIIELSKKCNFAFMRYNVFAEAGEVVSSTLIRNHLSLGDIETANKYLGRSFEMNGVVVEGAKRGRTIGFPTANMSLREQSKIIPKTGVYAVIAEIEGYEECKGMLNIGFRPTIEDGLKQTIETYLFDFESNIYGKAMRIRLVRRLREEQKFGSIDQLKGQLEQDEKDCKEYFSTLS